VHVRRRRSILRLQWKCCFPYHVFQHIFITFFVTYARCRLKRKSTIYEHNFQSFMNLRCQLFLYENLLIISTFLLLIFEVCACWCLVQAEMCVTSCGNKHCQITTVIMNIVFHLPDIMRHKGFETKHTHTHAWTCEFINPWPNWCSQFRVICGDWSVYHYFNYAISTLFSM